MSTATDTQNRRGQWGSRTLTEPLLRALVAEAHGQGDAGRVLAVAAAPTWEGDPVVETAGGPTRVVPCVSALAVREALLSAAPEETLVLLTDREESELGDEVLAQVWRHRLLRPSGWEALAHLFRVDRLDPALADARWLVDLLVDVAPPHGYPPPPSGLLDEATAWRTMLRHALRLPTDRPNPADLLRWGQTEDARASLGGPARDDRDAIAARLTAEGSPLADHVLRLVAEGRGTDLVPLGLVCDVLWAQTFSDEPAVLTARARFEGPVGARDLTEPSARSWADAATELVRLAEATGDVSIGGWLARAEHILADLDALDLAAASDVLPAAFTQRLDGAGRRLSELLDSPNERTLEAAASAARQVRQHLRAEVETQRVRQLGMAIRLGRRLCDPPQSTPGDLAAAAAAFVADGAYVDAARDALADGETVVILAAAYGRLADLVDAERLERDRTFAAAFAGWSTVLPNASQPLLPIERVLDEVVVLVAREAPVLLLVLDGLSHPEAVRLLGDIAIAGWTPNAPADGHLPLVVAAVPTVTATSRTSLLCGRLADGDQAVERDGFAVHAGLRDAASGGAPRLFHKRDLGIEQGRIAPEVHEAILDTDVRVVGVVVNGVDDHLDKGAQLRLADGLAAVKPLRWLLDAAAEAGRAVVLTSDHGHIREHGTTVRPAAGGGERWRPADTPAVDDEVTIGGPRVLRGGGTVIAPATAAVRYIPNEKYGYHGGATPQEVLCPLAVLTPARVSLDGWEPLPPRRPAWWDPAAVLPGLPTLTAEPEPVVDADGQPTLFPTAEPQPVAPEVPSWIRDVLTSPAMAEQRQLAGRTALDDAAVARHLQLLDAAGGVVPAEALARATGVPAMRLRSKLEALRRILNVDGYPVLTLEADGTARLNRDMLLVQFGVER